MAPSLRVSEAPVEESARSYSAGRGEIQTLEVCNEPRTPVVASSLRVPEAQEQQQTMPVFPTDSKEREKQKDAENKEKGIEKVAKRKPKVIERHYDDCGDDLRGLCGAFHHCHGCQCGDGCSSSSDEEQGVPLMQHDESQYLPS